MSSKAIIHVPRRYVSHEWGGTETVILETSKQQKLKGYNPSIITSMALSDQASELIQGVPVSRYSHIYPFFGLSAQQKQALDMKGGNLLSLPLLMGLLQSKDVRVFHAHALKRLGATVRTAARIRKKPYVVSLHGGAFDVPAEELSSLIDPIRGKFEWGKPFGAILGSRKVLTDADHVICVGENEAEIARSKLPHDRVSYLPNGVDFSRFSSGDSSHLRKHLEISPKDYLIVSVGRIDMQKNQLCLLKAFKEFKSRVPHAKLVIVGAVTQPDYLATLKDFIKENDLVESVKFLSLENDDPLLVNVYHAADLFVLASRHEPFGIVVLEAWCAACPVIASKIGGLKTLINEQKTGLLFDLESEESHVQLAAKMSQLHADPSLASALGAAGKIEAKLKYDWTVITERLDGIYQLAEEHQKLTHP